VRFRPLAKTDLPLLAEWLKRAHVAQWWRERADLTTVTAAYGPMIDRADATEGFIALYDGQPFAFLQRYLLADNSEWAVAVGWIGAAASERGAAAGNRADAGIDYLIGEESMTGRGLGRQMIARFVDLAWVDYPEIDAVVVAVQQENRASWHALEGAGFRRTWAGTLDSDDPSDQGPSFLYLINRPTTS
jgi:aminoglycoside 6'-N-acetyltransferase